MDSTTWTKLENKGLRKVLRTLSGTSIMLISSLEHRLNLKTIMKRKPQMDFVL